GEGRTLLDKAPITFRIPFARQIQDLKDLFDTSNLPGPQVIEGLSYGGGLALAYAAKYPNDFAKVIAVSPYLHPIPSQVQWIKAQIALNRMTFPLNPATDAELYDYFFRDLVMTQ